MAPPYDAKAWFAVLNLGIGLAFFLKIMTFMYFLLILSIEKSVNIENG